ncbi:nickel pincer cofactor biosynthesis protein LarB [bacterium]|nr:nickel pincer cofactor biosynthesis protein LarB [bacterium]
MKKIIKEVNGIAKLDIYRDKKCGIPEVILAEGKEPKWVAQLLTGMVKERGIAIASRVDKEYSEQIKRKSPKNFRLKYYTKARMVILSKANYKVPKINAQIGLLAAGTADIPVAEEAKVTMELLGCKVITAYDVGIAGMHRLFAPLEKMLKEKVACIVVVAGMEGALPTVVKSLIDIPVIGVPTSVGYGYGGKGESALMTMLQSCSPGLVVVNIDNGFGAGAAAVLIAKQSIKGR